MQCFQLFIYYKTAILLLKSDFLWNVYQHFKLRDGLLEITRGGGGGGGGGFSPQKNSCKGKLSKKIPANGCVMEKKIPADE